MTSVLGYEDVIKANLLSQLKSTRKVYYKNKHLSGGVCNTSPHKCQGVSPQQFCAGKANPTCQVQGLCTHWLLQKQFPEPPRAATPAAEVELWSRNPKSATIPGLET